MSARIGLLVKFDPPAPLACISRFVRAADQFKIPSRTALFKIPSRNDLRLLRKFYLRSPFALNLARVCLDVARRAPNKSISIRTPKF
ncbi:hypothetical protein [uncultured Campylobacter sp.]|uniref:hypothetical protein n=1 Tax=uncultured Campylobacter sp. TaxID=218934 RepID=UPI0025EFD965|nr:hypothetical protein [uncultured Campylobacter sp.]